MDNITTHTYTETLEQHRADSLARRVFSLEEPWRSRFIAAITVAARRIHSVGVLHSDATEADVAHWLLNRALSQQVSTMLSAWTPETSMRTPTQD